MTVHGLLDQAAVRIEDYQETLRGHRVLHLVGRGNKPATMPLTVPMLRVLEACRGQRTELAGRSERDARDPAETRSSGPSVSRHRFGF